MKKVILLGGSFDPIHNGHLAIAEHAKELLHADEVWFLPLRKPRWKQLSSSQTDRIKMLKLALAEHPDFKLCDYELTHYKAGEPTYSINTITGLKELYPDIKFYFLIGTDHLELLPKWIEIDKLCKMVTFVLANRPGYQMHRDYIKKYGVVELGFDGPFVSSSMIRVFASTEMPKCVLDYIRDNGLYLADKLALELSEERYDHSVRVAKLARKIAIANKYNVKKAYIAAILHDCAKELPTKQSLEMMKTYFEQYMGVPRQLYHQFNGSIVAHDLYRIEDPEILEAIKFHATGCGEMSKLAKIIYAADKIEPGRRYDSSDMIAACIKKINTGFAYVLGEYIEFLRLKNGTIIHPLTLEAYNKYVKGGKYDKTAAHR